MNNGSFKSEKNLSLYKIPPQNIEAEESLLSAIILDNSTLLEVLEIIRPDDFYVNSHKIIFEAIIDLFQKSDPIDLITLTNHLTSRGQIEQISGGGDYRGVTYLSWLTDAAPRAVNAPYYALIVRDKACLRRLIQKTNEITKLCYEEQENVDEVINFAESAVFEISEDKINPSFHQLSEMIESNIDTLEERQGNKTLITGIPTGFTQLDSLTSGLQPSDLIILAARPSMGKCCEAATEIVLADGSITTIENIYKNQQASLLTLNNEWKFQFVQPSHFIDDGKKPVFRITTKLGRFVETTLTHPFLTIQGWKPLSELSVGNKIAVPRELNVFGKEKMRECEVKLLAYLIGDGNLTNTCPRFTNTDSRVLADFIEAVEDFGGIKATLSKTLERSPEVRIASGHDFKENRIEFAHLLQEKIAQNNFSSKEFSEYLGASPSSVSGWINAKYVPSFIIFEKICSILETEPDKLMPEGYTSAAKNSKNDLNIWLEELGIQGKNSHEKFIPEPIFRLSRNLMILFINRLFATDGWATVLSSGQSQLGYASVSEKLIRQIQHLLLRFGIIAKIRKRGVLYAGKRNSIWQLDITDADSIRIFIKEIGIFGKEGAVEKINDALISKKYQTNVDLIPIEIWEQISMAKADEPWAKLARRANIPGWSNIHVGKRAMKRSRLEALANALDDLSLLQLATSEVYWDEIVSIESMGKKQVYDLTIPGTHNFIANDICVHNTAFALNLARNAAVDGGTSVALFSLEMSKEQLSMRMLCAEARVDSSRLRGGFFSRDDWDSLTEAAGVLSEAPVFIDDSADISATEIRAKCRRLKMEKNLGLVIIDYLQLMKGRASSERRDLEISEISRSLKALAKELNIPVIALSQLNRKLEERADKRPMLSDLRESGSIEQDADIVAFIYRDEVYNKDENNPNRGKAELILGKQRNGPIGTAHMVFLNTYTRFENPAPEDLSL